MSNCHQGGSELRINSVDNLYFPTSSFSICFSVEDSGPSAETCFDPEQRACTQTAAFLSPRTHIMPSTYVYTPFVSGLVLAKSVAVDKRLGKHYYSIACCTGHILRGHVAIITKPSPHYVLTESTISGPWRSIGTRSSPDFSPQLRDEIWEWPGDKANKNV